MIRSEDSLEYHRSERPGKIELRATKACLTPREIRLAYLPGASFPSQEIARDPSAIFQYTARGNLVGVISDGSGVPGLGNVGPGAAKPMQEGLAVLFKRLADLDVFDLEIRSCEPEQFVETVKLLEPTFGGINLKDIAAPAGLEIYDRLRDNLQIPVLHENLHSSAVVACAALLNALDLVDKKIDEVQVVICGAGTVGIGCARLFRRLGVPLENLLVYDVNGLLHPGRDDLFASQREFSREHGARTLEEGLKDADVFLGASAGGVVSLDMVRSMNRYPVIFSLATPEPEIGYEEARGARRDAIVATGLGQYPNAILDLLSCPYIFRGALDVQATRITEGMLIAAARALAELAREDVVEEVARAYGQEHFSFGPEYLVPTAIDPRILVWESAAVARQAVEEGVAQTPLDPEAHRENLGIRLGTGREILRNLTLQARQSPLRVVFSEGADETVLRACGILMEEGIAKPILLGSESSIRERIERLGLDLGGASIINPGRSSSLGSYIDEYFQLRGRRGVIRAAAARRVEERDCFAAMMVHRGDADMMIAGVSTHYIESLRTIVDVIGPAPGFHRISSHYLVLLPKDVVFLADCAVNIDPPAEVLAEIAIEAARMCRSLGFEPRVAMLSFSNFGSVGHPSARKVRLATELAKQKAPGLIIDGEMQIAAARDGALRKEYFPFSSLVRDANVLVFPDLQSGNLALQALQHMADAVPIGPVLMGTRLPAHLLQYGAAVEEVVNLTTVGVVEAAARRSSDLAGTTGDVLQMLPASHE